MSEQSNKEKELRDEIINLKLEIEMLNKQVIAMRCGGNFETDKINANRFPSTMVCKNVVCEK